MQKAEFLKLLQDPEVCQAIVAMIKNGGKPVKPESDSGALAGIRDKIRSSFSLLSDDSSGSKAPAAKAPAKPAAKPAARASAKAAPQPKAPEPAKPETPAPAEKPKPAATPLTDNANSPFSDKLDFLRKHVNQAVAEREAQKQEEEAAPAAASKEQYTFVLERECPVCGHKTRVVKCKQRLIVESTDSDLCIHYKDFNPYLYRIWACEHCGYAAEEKRFLRPLPQKTQEKLLHFLNESNLAMPFMEERTPAAALSYCEMAVLFSELADPSYNRRANLYLIMAWIYRYEGDKDHEQAMLDKAGELFDLSLESEGYPVDSMSDTTATYLAGAIHALRHDYGKASRHLSRLISDQSLRTSAPNVYNKARDLWQEIKESK